MCGLKEIFEGAGNFCDKKVPCKSHFSIREKLNLIRFIKTLYKTKIPSSVTAWHLLHRGEGSNWQFESYIQKEYENDYPIFLIVFT